MSEPQQPAEDPVLITDAALSYDWDYGWEGETEALCDPRLPSLLREAGIVLTSFSRLGGEGRP